MKFQRENGVIQRSETVENVSLERSLLQAQRVCRKGVFRLGVEEVTQNYTWLCTIHTLG